MADRQRGPFAHAVGGQDRRAPRGSGEKRGGRVRMVVAGEQDLRPWHAEVRRDDAAHPDLFAERVLDGAGKRPPGVRERPQRAGQDPIELPHAALVEDDRVEVGWIETGVIQAPFDGPERKAGVVLVPRQALFLHGADRHAVDDERGGRIVVVGGNAEDLHLSTGSVGESASCRAIGSPANGLAALGALGQPGERREHNEIHDREDSGAEHAGDRRRHPQVSLPQTARARPPDLPPVRRWAGRGRAACRCSSCGTLHRGGSLRRSRMLTDRPQHVAIDREAAGRRFLGTCRNASNDDRARLRWRSSSPWPPGKRSRGEKPASRDAQLGSRSAPR